jgi:GntR family transcriptional regulator
MVTALGRLAEQLQIAERSELISREQQRWIDGDPWSLQTNFYPMELVRKGASRLLETKPIAGGTASYLEHELGIKQVRARDEIRVRVPDPREYDFFRLPADGRIWVLEVSRTAYDEQDHPILLTITVYPADRNHLAYEI